MKNDVGQNSIFDTLILEYTGLFKILNPHSPKFHNINFFKLAAKFELIILTSILFMLIISIYYSSNDLYGFFTYVLLFVGFFDMTLNHFYLIKYSEEIWDFMRIININFLSTEIPKKDTFKAERLKYKLATTITMIMASVICISWVFSPLFRQENKLTIHFRNNVTHNYRITPINLILSITDEFYNQHYELFYAFDSIGIIFICHVSTLFDFIVITMCISIECQLKSIGNSYSAFTFVNKIHATSKQFFI